MNRVPLALLAILPILVTPSAALPAGGEAESPKITGSYVVEDGLRVLRLWGTPGERGFAQGWLLAREIVKGADEGVKWALEGRMEIYRNQLRPLAAFGFVFSKGETEELEGILRGIRARLPEEERKLSALGRELDLTDLKVLNSFGDWYALGCSSAAVWGSLTEDGKAAVVRNFDFSAMELMVSSQHVRVAAPIPGEPGRRGWVGVCHPAGIGTTTAMSGEGVFAAIHDVDIRPEQKDFLQGNVPRLVAIRRLVEELPAKGAVEAAAERLRTWSTLYGNNFIVATPEPGDGLPAGVLEYDTRENDGKGVALRGPDATPAGGTLSFVVCSNHHRARGSGRCGRYDALVKGCAATDGTPFDLKGLFALAERSAVPKAGEKVDRFGTLHQAVALTGAKKLYLRFVARGGNIRDVPPRELDVAALLAGLGR